MTQCLIDTWTFKKLKKIKKIHEVTPESHSLFITVNDLNAQNNIIK